MLIAIARDGAAARGAYNVCSGIETSLSELGAALVRAAGTGAQVEFTGRARPGDPMRWVGDPERARALGTQAETGLDEGLARTVAWLRAVPLPG